MDLFGGRGQHEGATTPEVSSSQRDIMCILQPLLTRQALISVKITSLTLVSLQAVRKLQAASFLH